MFHHKHSRIRIFFLSAFLCINTWTSLSLPVHATYDQLRTQAEERKSLPIQTNEIENWPIGPAIGAESAILIEANTGVILYAKNIDQKLYPASTTKIMTCLLAVEHAKLNDMVTFSRQAVFSIEKGSSNIGMDVGQSISLEQALYGIMVGSANEVANAVGEYIAGDAASFAEAMNRKAIELGCKNSNFVNASGLYNDEHYTTAYDLSLIACAFFKNELLSKVSNTVSYHFEPTATQPDEFTIRNKHKLINGEIKYDHIIGGKTGYTDISRQTLVTCAEKNGMKLVCVILKEESPEQFNDTVRLFDYGFNNFHVANVAENETHYTIENASFFQVGNDVFGNSKPILSLNQSSYLIMPKTVDFDDLTSEISYDTNTKSTVAEINYSYHGTFVGRATVDLAADSLSSYDFEHQLPSDSPSADADEGEKVVFINVKNVLLVVLSIAAIVILTFVVRAIIMNYHFSQKRYRRLRRRRRRRERSKLHFDDDF